MFSRDGWIIEAVYNRISHKQVCVLMSTFPCRQQATMKILQEVEEQVS